MQRDEFLARVRTATAAGRAYQVELNPHATAEQSYVGGGADPVGTFLLEWQAVGGVGHRCSDREQVLTQVAAVIERHAVRSVLLWKHPVLERLGLREWLQQRSLTVYPWDELESLPDAERREISFAADLGITSVDWAIAETGSLVMCSRPGGQGRSASLLPPVHIAILEPAQLLPDLFDLFQQLDPKTSEIPSNVVLITGPSKTGDIQLQLTTGVHGPGEVHAMVWEQTP